MKEITEQSGALELLTDDHRRIGGLFELLQQSDDQAERRTLFQTIKDELELHSFVEEKIFYPRLMNRDEISDFLDDFYDEHQEIKDLLQEIDDIEAEADCADESDEEIYEELESAIEELGEVFQHHVDEEERQLFPWVRATIVSAELRQLAHSMIGARGHLKAA